MNRTLLFPVMMLSLLVSCLPVPNDGRINATSSAESFPEEPTPVEATRILGGDARGNEAELLQEFAAGGDVIYLPILPSAEDSMTALLEGKLYEENGCLRVTAEGYEDGFLILWPYGSGLSLDDNAIEVHNSEGEVVARLGESLRIGGGAFESAQSIARLDESIPGMPIDGCPGPYWVAGELETLAQQSVADVYVTPFTSGDQLLAIFISQSRPAENRGMLTGKLVLTDDSCLQVNGHTILWPPQVFLREDPLHLVVPGEVPLAEVGYPISVPGSLKEPGDYRYFEDKVPCPGPYWGAAAMNVFE